MAMSRWRFFLAAASAEALSSSSLASFGVGVAVTGVLGCLRMDFLGLLVAMFFSSSSSTFCMGVFLIQVCMCSCRCEGYTCMQALSRRREMYSS